LLATLILILILQINELIAAVGVRFMTPCSCVVVPLHGVINRSINISCCLRWTRYEIHIGEI